MIEFKSMKKLAVSAAASVALLATAGQAQDGGRVEVGQLVCDVSGGVGLLLGSRKKMECVFERADGSKENYSGRVAKLGIDIGITKESVVWWAVLAPSTNVANGALDGEYVGVTAEATVGVGAGANLLVGGGENSIALQPLSLQAQQGLNIAGGIGSIKLEYEG